MRVEKVLKLIFVMELLFSSAAFSDSYSSKIMTKETRTKHVLINRELTWSMIENLITLNELNLANSVLEEHLKKDTEDGKSWLFKSQVLSRLGKEDEAFKSIQKAKKRIGSSEPDMLLFSESELAMAKGNHKKGLQGFKKIAQGNGPLSKKAERAVEAIERKRKNREVASLELMPGLIEPKTVSEFKKPKEDEASTSPEDHSSWTGNANLSLMTGYDANILQIADSITPFASNLGSFYSSLGFQGVLSGNGLGGVMSVSGSAGYTRNLNSIAEGLNNLNLSGGLQWSPKISDDSNFSWSLGLNAASTFMESSSYNLYFISTGFSPTMAYRITNNMNAELSLNYGINRYPGVELTSAKDSRRGYQYGGNIGIRGVAGSGSYSTGLGYNQQIAEGQNFNTDSYNFTASYSQPISFWKSSLSPGIGYTKVQYPNSETGRSDNMYVANLGWEVPVQFGSQNLKTTSSLGWTHVKSADETATFTKTTFMFQVVYAIK